MLPKHSQLLSVSTVEPCFSSRHPNGARTNTGLKHTTRSFPRSLSDKKILFWNRFLGWAKTHQITVPRTIPRTALCIAFWKLSCRRTNWVADAPTPLPLGCSEDTRSVIQALAECAALSPCGAHTRGAGSTSTLPVVGCPRELIIFPSGIHRSAPFTLRIHAQASCTTSFGA